MESIDYIFGIRAVIEAIEAGKKLTRYLSARISRDALLKELLDKLHLSRVPVQRVPVERINRITRKTIRVCSRCCRLSHIIVFDHIVPALYEDGVLPFVVVL